MPAQSTYELFWEELRPALAAAEARTRKGIYLDAIERLKRIEGYPKAEGHGQRRYLQSSDVDNPILAYTALREYVAHMYDGAPAPFWLTSAEGK